MNHCLALGECGRYFLFAAHDPKCIIWGLTRENLSSGVCVNTGADQHAHSRSLISAFVIRFVERSICKLATGEISIFLLVNVAEETGLKLAL